MENEGQLNFDTANLEYATQGAARAFDFVKDGLLPFAAVSLFVLAILALVLWAKKKDSVQISPTFLISNWPVGIKVSLVPLLVSYALTHAFSVGSVVYNTKIANPSTLAYFQELGVGRLFSLSHAHLFAHATMYFLVAVLVQFAGRGKLFSVYAPLAALWAGVFDVFSWWGLKSVSPNFEILSALCGSTFSIGFLLMAAAILHSAFCSNNKTTHATRQ